MKVKVRIYVNAEVIVAEASGRYEFGDAKAFVVALASHPSYDAFLEAVFDLRQADCCLSIAEVGQLSEFVAWPGRALPSRRRVAVVISKDADFRYAALFALCARKRGLLTKSFQDLAMAREWLQARVLPI